VKLLAPEFVSVVLQALNGFLLILTCEGEVFFATHSIESYLGFHQVRHDTDNYIYFFGVILQPPKSLGSTEASDMMTDGEGIWKKAVVASELTVPSFVWRDLGSMKNLSQKF
jgi:hypothetical protein